jgi:hypothetical protein
MSKGNWIDRDVVTTGDRVFLALVAVAAITFAGSVYFAMSMAFVALGVWLGSLAGLW